MNSQKELAASNKKVFFFLPFLSQGGGERVVSELSLGFPGNVKTTIVVFKNIATYPYKGKLICLNIPFPGNIFSKPFIFFLGLIKFKKIIKQEKPDWVISFGKLPNIINVLANKNSILRGDVFLSKGYNHFFGRIYKILVRALFNKAAKIIVVSEGLKRDFVDNFKIKEEKIKVIYNPIDIEKIKKLSKEPLDSEQEKIFNSPVIINIGRLDLQKGQWHLIRVFKEIKKQRPDIRLVILGQGELEFYLKELAENTKDIFFLGWQDNPFKLLARSRIFVLTSIWEGLGMAILESMVCRVPVVSVDCPVGPREIISSNSGILVPALESGLINGPLTKKENELKKEIIKVLDNKQLSDYLANNAEKRAEEFKTDNIINQWSFLWKS